MYIVKIDSCRITLRISNDGTAEPIMYIVDKYYNIFNYFIIVLLC